VRALAGAALAVVALVLAGCGSSSLSADQLRSGATRACNLARKRTDRIPTPTLPSGGGAFLSRGIVALAPELTTLRSLRPPSGMASDYQRALVASENELRALRSALKGLKAGDDPVVAIKTLQQQLAPLESESDGAWQSLGLSACAST
jgi:hypothetical protein